MKENVDELYEIVYLAKDIGADCLVYHPVIVAQDDMQNTIKSGHFWIRDDQIGILKKQIDMIVDYQKKYGLVAFLHDPYFWLGYFQNTLTKKHWKCNPFVFIDIGPDGYVRSCGPGFGSVKETKLNDCLNTKEAEIARERMRKCRYPCLQTCWAKPEADSLINIVQNFISQIDILQEDNKKKMIEEALWTISKYEDLILRSYK